MNHRTARLTRRLHVVCTWMAIVATATAGLPLHAAANEWTAGSTTNFDWSDAANWQFGVPDANSDLLFLRPVPNPGTLANPDLISLAINSLANSLTFHDSYTLSGGSLSVTSGQWNVYRGMTATVDSLLTGSGGLTLTGGGALRLNNAGNDFTGTTTVANGTLVISDPGALGADTSAVVVQGSATRGFGGGSLLLEGTYGGGMNFTRDLLLQGRGPNTDRGAALVSVGSNTISGNITTGVGAIATGIASSGGHLTLAGNLAAGAETRFGIVNSAGIGSYSIEGAISGAGTILTTGNQRTLIWNPSDASGFSGIINHAGGFLRIASGDNLGTSTSNSGITLGAGAATLEIRTDAPSSFNTRRILMSTSANAVMMLDHGVDSFAAGSINQTVEFDRLTFTAGSSTRTLTINSRNGYGATFASNVGGSLAGGNTLTINAGGVVTFEGNFWNQTNTTARTFTLTTGTAANVVIEGSILATGANHVFTKGTGAGTLTILGTASTFTGATNLQGGNTIVYGMGALGAPASTANINFGSGSTTGTLTYLGTGDTVTRTVNLAGTSGGGVIDSSGSGALVIQSFNVSAGTTHNKTLTLRGSSDYDILNEISGNITNSVVNTTGSVAVTKTGTNTWVLSGFNTYTGNTNITGGRLILKSATGGEVLDSSDGSNNVVFTSNGTTGSAAGILEYQGHVDGSTQLLGNLTPTTGLGTVRITPADGATGPTQLIFENIGTVGTGASLNFETPTSGTNGTDYAISIIGYATGFMDGRFYYNRDQFAYYDNSVGLGFVRGLDYGVDADTNSTNTALLTAAHNEITGSFANGAETIRSLRFDGGHELTLSGLLTINNGAATTAGGIIVSGGQATITGGSLTTGGAGSLVFNVAGESDRLTLATDMISTTTGGWTKNGAGTLVLAGTNLQSGTTTINEGTVQLVTGGRLSANSAALVIREGAVLDLNGVSTSTGASTAMISSFNGGGTIVNTSSDAVLFAVGGGTTGGTGTFAGSIIETNGQINVIKVGTSNSQTWTGISNYTGATIIGAPGVGTSGSLTVSFLANIGEDSTIGRGDATDLASNQASLVFGGTTGGLIYAGTTSVATDRLFTLAGTNASSAGATITNNAAANNALIFSNFGPIAFGASQAQNFQLSGTSLADNLFNPQIIDNGAAATRFTKTGTGLWILGNTNNSYTGATSINAGILRAIDGTTLPTASNLILNGGVLETSGNFVRTIGTGADEFRFGSAFANGGFSAAESKLVVDWGNSAVWGATTNFINRGGLVLSSAVSLAEVEIASDFSLGTAAGLGSTPTVSTSSGSATVTLTAGNTNDMIVGQAISGTNIPAGSFIIAINSATSITISANASATGTGIAATVSPSALRTIRVDDNTSTGTDFATITGVISGNAGTGIQKTGTGALQLLGANTYDGVTSVLQGTLVVNSLGHSGSPGVGTSVGISTNADQATNALTLGNSVTGAGILQYVGAGEVSDRMIRLNSTTASNQIHADGSGALVLTNVQNDMVGGNKTLILRGTNTDGNMISSVLADNGGTLGVTIDGGATWILAGDNTLTGTVTVGAGALGIGHDNAIGSGLLSIGSASTFAYGGDRTVSNTVRQASNVTHAFIGQHSLNFTGTFELQPTTANVVTTNNMASNATLSFNNVAVDSLMTASRTWTINGSGNTTINGNIVVDQLNTHAFNLNITHSSSGVLTLGGTASDWRAGLLTVNNGTLRLAANDTIPFGLGKGNVVFSPAAGVTATFDLNGFNQTLNGFTATTAGTINIDNTSATAATLSFGANDQAVNFLPTIGTGTGSIGNSGGGALSIAKVGTAAAVIGNSTLTYTGSTSVSGGSLTINADSDLAGTTGLSVTGGATLNILGGFSASTSVTSVTVGDGSHLNLLNGSGDPLSNLTSLTLGNNAILSLNVGATSNTLTLTGAATATGLVTLNISNTGSMLGNTTYDLLVASGGGLTAGGGNYALDFIPGGFDSLTLNQTDNLVSLTTGNLITSNVYWTGANNTKWNEVDGSFNGLNWSSDKSGAPVSSFVPGAGSTVVFQANNAAGGVVNTTLEQNFFINALEFETSTNPATTVTIDPGAFAAAKLSIAPTNSADGINLKTGGPTNVAISTIVELAANQTWTVADAGSTLTVTGALSGTGSLAKAGAGRVVLFAPVDATFAVPTVDVNAGELQITNIAALGTTALGNLATINVNAGGMFYYNGAAATTVNTINLNGGTLSAGGGTQTYSATVNVLANSTISMLDPVTLANGRSITLSGGLSGTGDLTVDGIDTVTSGNQITGTLTLNQDNSAWTGNWNILRGSVSTNNANGLGSGSTITMEKGRFLFTAGAGTPTVTQNIIIASATENALGEFNLATGIATTFTGQITLGGVGGTGEFRLTSANDAATGTILGGVVLANDGLIGVINAATRVLHVDSVISEIGGPRALRINDATFGSTAGIVRLTGANTFTGDLTVARGIVEFNTITDAGGAASSLGQGNAIFTEAASTLRFIADGGGAQSTNRAITSGTGSLTLDARGINGASITYTGAITIGPTADGSQLVLTGLGGSAGTITTGGFTQTSTTADVSVTGGTWTLVNSTNTVADDLFIIGPTAVLNLGSAGVLQWGASANNYLDIRNGGTLNLGADDAFGAGIERLYVGLSASGDVAVLNTNGFSVTTPRLDIGYYNPGREGLVTGNGTITVTAATEAGGLNLYRGIVEANLAGVAPMFKGGLGTVTLSGDNSGLTASGTAVTAKTRFDSGTVILDYTSSNTDKLSAAAQLDLRGVTVIINGNASAPTSQSVLSTTFASNGAARVEVNAGAGQEAVLNLGDLIRAASAGTVRFVLPDGTQSATNGITTTRANHAGTGLLGSSTANSAAYATATDATGTWFATRVGTNIVGLVSTAKNDVATWLLDEHITDTAGGFTGSVQAARVNSLRFDAAAGSTLNLAQGGVLSVVSGGILVTDNVAGPSGISGGTLVVGANTGTLGPAELVFFQDSAETFTVSANIRRDTAITKAGTGTLLLEGNNFQTGIVRHQQGTLQLAGGNALGDTARVLLSTFDFSTLQLLANETIGSIEGGSTTDGLREIGVVDVGEHTLTISGRTGGARTYSGRFAGTGTIVKDGLGDNLNYNNISTDFTGTVVVNGGLFQLSNIGRIDAQAWIVNKGGTLLLDNNGSTRSGTRILDTASITLNSADGAFAASTIVRGLSIRTDQNSGTSTTETVGDIHFASGASYAGLDHSGGTSSRGVIIANDFTRANSATLTVRGRDLGANANGRAQLRIGTTANETAFIANHLVGGGGALGTTTQSIVPWAIGENYTGANLAATNMGNSLVTYVAGRGFIALDFGTEYSDYASATPTSNVRESLTTDVVGLPGNSVNALVIHNANAAASTINITGLGAGHALHVNSGAVLFTLNTAAAPSSAHVVNIGGFDDGLTVGGNEYVIHVVNPSGDTATTPTLTAVVNSALASAADITKSGRGTLVLTGANTAGGGSQKTTINEGILEIGSLSNIGGATGDLVFAGGTLRVSNAVDFSTRNVTFLQGGGTLDTNGNDVILAGSLGSGVGGFTKTGVGELWLSAAAGYTGDTNILGGTIVLFADNAIGSGNLNIGAGATLDLGGSSINVGLVTTSGASPIISSGGAINASAGYVFNHTGNTQIDADLNGAGGLLKQQSNVLTLTGAGNYAGLTEIQAGTLIINSIANVGAGPSALGNPLNDQDGVIRMGLTTGATTLTYDGSGHASDRLIGMQGTTGGVTLNANGTGAVEYGGVVGFTPGAKTLTIQGTSAGALVNTLGVVNDGVGTIAVTKAGTNTWHLANEGTFSGLVTVNGGVLSFDSIGNIGENSALGTGVNAAGAAGRISIGTTTTSATIRYTGAGHSSDRPVNLAGTTGGATIEASGTGALIFTGNFTATGAGSKNLTLAGSNTGNNTISGNIVDNGGTNLTRIVKSGAGTWLLDGDKSYTGTTTIQEGVLAVTTLRNVGAGDSSLGNPLLANSTIAIGSAALDATLRYVGTDVGGHSTDRVINLAGTTGGAALDASGLGAISFVSNFTATGAGIKTLTLTGSNTGANTISGDIVDNSGVNITSLVKEGTGRWVLSGTSKTYTGDTTINGGTLVVNTTLASPNVIVNDGGRLMGSAALQDVTINSGGVHAPGNSVTNQAVTNYTMNGGGILEWDFAALANLGVAGTDWDLLTVSNTLQINATDSNPFVIRVVPLALPGDNTPGLVPGFDAGTTAFSFDNGWLFAQAGTINGFDASYFTFDASLFRTMPGYEMVANESFTVYQGTGGLYVNYSYVAVPEPGSMLLVGLGALGFAGFGWRRRRKGQAAGNGEQPADATGESATPTAG